MTSPLDAWILRRILANLPLNGELDALTGVTGLMAGYLARLPLEERQSAWEAMVALAPDRTELIVAVSAVDPLGPPPATPDKRRSAHLGDLTRTQSEGLFVWPNWIVRAHFTLLSSDPKVGKTHFSLDLARRLHGGLHWPDGHPPTFSAGTTTLWICGDRHQDELRERAAAFGLPPEAVRLNALPDNPYGGWDLDNPEDVGRLGDLVRAERPGLVFIDTVWRATRHRLSREDEVNMIMTPIVSIAQERDVAIVGLMHLSKDQDTLGRRLEGLARGIIKMHKPDPAQPNRRRLEVSGNFKEPPPLGVTMHDGGCDYDFDPPQGPGRNPRGRPSEKCDLAVAYLTERLSHGDCKAVDLVNEWVAMGESKTSFFAAKKEMEADGRLVVDDSGKLQIWHLVKSQV